MNKNDLVSLVADRTGFSKGDAAKAVDGVLDAITQVLQQGDDVRLVGFGTFSVGNRKASQGRNPRTGEPLMIEAARLPAFRAGRALKDRVRR